MRTGGKFCLSISRFFSGLARGCSTPYLRDRKSTRLNSSHTVISYAVFCLKKKKKAYALQLRKRPFLTGEASPSYLFHPLAPNRVAEVLPHVKLIALLRNPVSRAYSQYHHAIELGFETLSFEEAIRGEEERTAKEQEKILKNEHYYSDEYKHRSYLTKGIYVDQLQTWMKVLPRE